MICRQCADSVSRVYLLCRFNLGYRQAFVILFDTGFAASVPTAIVPLGTDALVANETRWTLAALSAGKSDTVRRTAPEPT